MELLDILADFSVYTWMKIAVIFVVLYIPAALTLIWIRSAEPTFKDCDTESRPMMVWDEQIVA